MSNIENNNTTNKGNFDLSGVFHVQKKYLTDLSNSYPNVNNAPLVANYVLDLQKKIKKTSNSYDAANTSANNVLTEQNKMINIVNDEQRRLEEKKFLIDQAESEERRKGLLTESQRLRKAAYTKIIIVLIICIVIHIILFLCVKHLFEPPIDSGINTIFILLHIFNFALWTIVAFYIYVNIQVRSQINFNKLELPPPKLQDTSTTSVTNYNNLFKDLGLCYSDGCCGENTAWDDKAGLCTTDALINTPAASNIESFVTPNSLNIGPIFKTEKKTEQRDEPQFDPSTFDHKTSSIEDVRKFTRLNVREKMKNILGPTMDRNDELNKSLDETIDELDNKPSIDTDELNDLGNDVLNDAMPGKAVQGKCYFTTMGNASELNNYKKTNRIVYHPSENHELLPTNTLLDNEIYHKGLNYSKELTDRFSNYK